MKTFLHLEIFRRALTPAPQLLALAMLCGGSFAMGQNAAPPAAQAAATTPAPPKAPSGIHFKPPVSGAPVVRGTGGTRGGPGELATLTVLAPEQEGLTTQAQPVLFWFQSAAAKADFELTLTAPKKAEPLLNLRAGREQKPGIHSVSLAAHKVTLEPNVSYRWSVALVPDTKSRSKDTVASGVIRRVEPSGDLGARIKNSSPAESASIYAAAGYWYDALQAISNAINADPKNAAYHRLRASLLEQGKLKEAASFASR